MTEQSRLWRQKLSRRALLRGAAAGLAVPVASALLAACAGGQVTPTPAPAAPTPAPAQTPAAGTAPAEKEVVFAILHFSVIEGTTWSGAHDRAGKRLAE
ncbi:MAG: BMP family ABC transporter substrate-binding protein, partial [Thermomicrobium sp.]